MKFTATQTFAPEAGDVLDLYSNPQTWSRLPTFERVKIVEVLDSAGTPERPTTRVRYRFTADLPAAARAVVDPNRLSWVEETTYDLARRTSTMRFVPDEYASKLQAGASATFSEPAEGKGVIRSVSGDLKVRVMLVGGQVERVIVAGLKDYLAEEHRAMNQLAIDG